MTQSFLYMRHKSTTHAQVAVFKEINMQLIQIGADFGTDEDPTEISAVYNRVIHWENDLFAINGNNIYKYDVAANTGIWELFYTQASAASAKLNYRAGLTPCSIDGSGVLVTGYPDAFQQHRMVVIDKEFNVTETTFTGMNSWAAIDGAFMIHAISHRNQIIFWNRTQVNAPRIYSYDLKEETYTQLTLPDTPYSPHNQLCVLNDKLYVALPKNSSKMHLWRLDGTSFTDLGEISAGNNSPAGSGPMGGGALVAVNGKLFAFYTNMGADNWSVSELIINADGGLDGWNDVTSVIVPASLGSKTTGVTSMGTMRIDSITDPLNPIYEFLVAVSPTEGQSVDLYRWSSPPSGTMTLVGAGLDANRYSSISTNDGTGGGRIWSGSGVLNVSSPDLSVNLNLIYIDADFTLYGPTPNLGGVSLELYFDKEGEVTSTRGTIVTTTHGSIVDNRVTGLTADNATKVTVGWAAVTDGIQPGDNPTLAARVFIP